MKALLRILLVLSICILLFGCGGGSAGGPQTGTFEVRVVWPAIPRLLPVDSQSVVAILSDAAGNVLGTQTLARPESGSTVTTGSFTSVPAGQVMLAMTAYPDASGAGGTGNDNAQAVGSAPGTVTADQTTTITVTMASTITSVVVTPADPTIAVGATQQMVMTAYNALNQVVLTSPNTTTWNSATTADATITTSGVVTGVAQGSSLVTATETESGKSGNTTVTVATGTGTVIGKVQ
jgi:uncharacterized protein YjdB